MVVLEHTNNSVTHLHINFSVRNDLCYQKIFALPYFLHRLKGIAFEY